MEIEKYLKNQFNALSFAFANGLRAYKQITTQEPDVDLENDMRAEQKHEEEVEQLIGYAVKEGYLDETEAENMTGQQKEAYYNKSMAYEPNANE